MANSSIKVAFEQFWKHTVARIGDGITTANNYTDTMLSKIKIIGGVTANTTKNGNATNIDITSLDESYMRGLGKKSHSGNVSSIDGAMSSMHNATRSAYCNPAGVTVEYSTDSGDTWTDYGLSDDNKINLSMETGYSVYCGKRTGSSDTSTTSDQLRITFCATDMGIYVDRGKFLIYISTNGANGATVKVEHTLYTDQNTWVEEGVYTISGWGGWNSIPYLLAFGSNQSSNAYKYRLTFSYTSTSTNYSNRLLVKNILLKSFTAYQTNSTQAGYGRVYGMDAKQNVYFPNKVTLGNGLIMTTEEGATSQVLTLQPDNDTANNYGNILLMSGGGDTYVGSGEAPSNYFGAVGKTTSEDLYLCADGKVTLASNCNTIANRKELVYNSSGALVVPANTDYTTYKARNVGAGTSSLTAGTSSLTNGAIYLKYS